MIPKVNKKLTLACLTPEQKAQTCGYWYVMQSGYGPYTAFRTRAALEFFLEINRLELESPLPDEVGTHAHIRIAGETRERMHGSTDTLPTEGRRILKMSNGDYTLGIVTESDDGPVVHYAGPNAHRLTFDHAMARAHEDAGHVGPMTAMI